MIVSWLRAASSAGLVVLLGAQACGEDSNAKPTGSAGAGGNGGASASTTGGGENTGAGGDGLHVAEGGAAFRCRATSCEPETLVGECPATAPGIYDPCSTFGSSCVYCASADTCTESQEPFIFQCCMFDGKLSWSHNCLRQCPLSELEKRDILGHDGGGGAGGANAIASAVGADAAQGCVLARPSACCVLDQDCPTGFECARSADNGGASACKPMLADESRCWQSSDCGGDGTCEGALFCSCTTECNDEVQGYCSYGPR